MFSVKEMMQELYDKELRQESFHENMTWDEYVAELAAAKDDDKALKAIIAFKKHEEAIDGITLTEIMSIQFMEAKKRIDQMTLAKRIALLEDVHAYRDQLYEGVDRYGKEGLSKDEQLSASDFRILMGRIKHLEILQGWLYGII